MTEEGILWEDINHFVDYLTCKDVELAFHLNEMLLHEPQKILHQFRVICKLLNRQLCKYEVLGRGYAFSKEPVLSPSVLVARLVLKGYADRFYKGMQYLWILDKDLVEHQRYHVQGIDLERMERSCLLLFEAFQTLHLSESWSESRFVEDLKEMALFEPNLGSELKHLSSRFVLIHLLLHKKRMMRRFVDIQRRLQKRLSSMTLLNEIGRFPELLLHEEENVFQCFLEWLPDLEARTHDSVSCLRLLRTLFIVWQGLEIPFEAFQDRYVSLKTTFPDAFFENLELCLDQKPEEWMKGSLFQLLQTEHNVTEKFSQVSERYRDFFRRLPFLLECEYDVEVIESNLDEICKGMNEASFRESTSVESLFKIFPEAIRNPKKTLEIYHRVKTIIENVLTEKERAGLSSQVDFKLLSKVATKLDAAAAQMEKEGHSLEKFIEFCQEKCDRLRNWKQNGSVPEELIEFLNEAPVEGIDFWLKMDPTTIRQHERSLWILFGKSPAVVFTQLCKMPNLLFEHNALHRAVLVARCFKVGKSDLRNENFRTAGPHLSSLMQILELTQRRPKTDEKHVLDVLERLGIQNLLSTDFSPLNPLSLAQFCILCVEHPEAWSQFERLIERVHHPLLAEARPIEMQRMKREAFEFILRSPEVFLIPDLWNAINEKLKTFQWTFAGLDVETIRSTEPCLFYLAVSHHWTQTYNQNAKKLWEPCQKAQDIKRRGKSIVSIRDLIISEPEVTSSHRTVSQKTVF